MPEEQVFPKATTQTRGNSHIRIILPISSQESPASWPTLSHRSPSVPHHCVILHNSLRHAFGTSLWIVDLLLIWIFIACCLVFKFACCHSFLLFFCFECTAPWLRSKNLQPVEPYILWNPSSRIISVTSLHVSFTSSTQTPCGFFGRGFVGCLWNYRFVLQWQYPCLSFETTYTKFLSSADSRD